MKTITPMKAWMAAATVDEQVALANRTGTSRGMLYQWASGNRQASAEMAGRIESATAEMHKLSKGRLPKIYRTDLCVACSGCQYAGRCLGARAVVSEFPIVDTRQMELEL